MTIVDWRHVDASALALVFARERARWLVELGWETRDSWLQVERARLTWGLPGLAAIDDGGRVRGLTFFHAIGVRFELGGVFAESAELRLRLLDAAVEVCAEAGGECLSGFFYAGASPSRPQLTARGFALESFDYLTVGRPSGHGCDRAEARSAGQDGAVAASSACAEIAIRDWRTSEVDALASLLHASYDGRAAARFASEHTVRGWRGYVGNLVDHTACGSVLPHVTRLAFWRDSLVGAVLVTALAPATAHIAQVAVHPDWRRRQLGGRLIDEAMALAWDAGYARATLLSSAENAAAQALYRTRGFTPTAEFLSATLPLDPAVARAS